MVQSGVTESWVHPQENQRLVGFPEDPSKQPVPQAGLHQPLGNNADQSAIQGELQRYFTSWGDSPCPSDFSSSVRAGSVVTESDQEQH